MEIIRFTHGQSELFEQSARIRYRVFVEEQKVPGEIEYDEFEPECHHYLVFVNGVPVATCRWRETAKGIKLERFAVLKEARGSGAGKLMVKHLLREVVPLGKVIYLHAQEQVTAFYAKYGFTATGPRFSEAGIQHYRMEHKLENLSGSPES